MEKLKSISPKDLCKKLISLDVMDKYSLKGRKPRRKLEELPLFIFMAGELEPLGIKVEIKCASPYFRCLVECITGRKNASTKGH